MAQTLAQALRDLSEQNNRLQLLREQFNDELTFEVMTEEFIADPISAQGNAPGRPKQNLDTITATLGIIGQLKLRIQITNISTYVTYDGQNCRLSELLLLIHDLKSRLNLIKSLCTRRGGSSRMHLFHGNDEQVKTLLDYDVDKMREERDRLITEVNRLDLFIQQTNFNTELIQ